MHARARHHSMLQGSRNSDSTEPVCATHLVLFPGARAEIWVTPQSHSATLLTEMISTGPAGDRWPQANLARIVAGQPAAVPVLLDVRAVAANTRRRRGTRNRAGQSRSRWIAIRDQLHGSSAGVIGGAFSSEFLRRIAMRMGSGMRRSMRMTSLCRAHFGTLRLSIHR